MAQRIAIIDGHPNCDQFVAWLKSAASAPRQIFVTHGDPAAAESLRHDIRREIPIEVTVPEHGESVLLEMREASQP